MRLISFVIIFSIIFNLLYIGISKADPAPSLVINGPSNMSLNQTATLTASEGCGGPYTWSLSGGGSLSHTTGPSVDYTAPASNANCNNNPIICVADSAGQKTYKQITVKADGSLNVAYIVNTCQREGRCLYEWDYYHTKRNTFCESALVLVNYYFCNGNYWGSNHCGYSSRSEQNIENCDVCYANQMEMTACSGGTSTGHQRKSCELLSLNCGGTGQHCYPLNEADDVRTPEMKAAGCCPAGLLPPPPPPVVVEQCTTCDLKIETFKGSDTILDRSSGGTVTFEANITSSKSFTWTLTIVGGSCDIDSINGSGNPDKIKWNGKCANNKVVDPGSYTATLSAQAVDDPNCKGDDNESFTIKAREKDCKLDVNFNSSLNIASGNLSHSQNLFTVPNSGLMSDFTLYYNSMDGYSGVLGTGWTHTYNIFLKADPSDDAYVLSDGRGGMVSLYKNGGYYTSDISAYPLLQKNADNTFTLTYKNGTVYNFNASGKLTAIADKNGNTVNLTYSSGGNLANITDPQGKTIYLSYDAGNRISAITDPNNNSYAFVYSGSTLTQVSSNNSLGAQTWRYTYDDKAFMLTKTDPLGNLVQYSYDADHRVSQTIDPQGGTINVQYDPENKTTTVTEKDGGIWIYKYDPSLGALKSKTDPSGGTIFYEYDSNRNLTSKIEADGTATTYTYDASGNMTSVTDALGNTTTYTYNDQNLVTGITDSTGKQTKYTYDTRGNILSTTDPAGAITQYTYDSKGNIISITAPNGGTTTMAYDANNNLISITDPSGQTTTQTYDNTGNMTSQTDAAGNKTTFQYNSLNQLIAVTDSAGKTTQYTYDAHGNRLSSTDANGNTTTYDYNYKNQLIQTTDAAGFKTAFTYGTGGCSSCGGGSDKLTSVIDAKNQTTTYQYDQTGRLIKETDPLGNATSYTYDAKGNMVSKTKPDGRTITYIYDDLNRLVERKYPNNTSDIFQYDTSGNMTGATNQNSAYYYSYDANNRVTGVAVTNLSSIYNIEYQYDIMGNRTMMTTPEGQIIKYSYNQNNQLTKIETDKGNYTFGYDSLNRRIKRTLPNDSYANYTYDQLSRLTNITHKNAFNITIDAFSYTYDNVGNRITKSDSDKNINYNYDQIYRLTKATPKSNNPLIQLLDNILKLNTESYSYDPVGNRQTGPNKNESYTYDSGNEMLNYSKNPNKDNQYEYDQNGNTIKKTETIQGKTKLITSYVYDDENRLTNVTIQRGDKVKEISFTYDPFGRRISQALERDDFAINLLIKPTYPQITNYVYDEQNIITEYDQNNKQTASYIYGPNIDEPLSAEIRNNRIYYHADGLGSITSLTNHMGMTIQKYDYDAFGNIKFTPYPIWIKQPYMFTAREFDSETGLYYYRARYYDPKVGRFVTKDPIGFGDGFNQYVYVKDNPTTLTDPTGLVVKRCKRDLDLCNSSSPYCPSSTGVNSRLHHDFISVNGEAFGLTTNNAKYTQRCYIEGPGVITHNLGIDQAAEIEGYMNGSCQRIECPCEQKLLDNLRIARAPYYCLKPGSGFGMNCQEWAGMMLNKYCNGN